MIKNTYCLLLVSSVLLSCAGGGRDRVNPDVASTAMVNTPPTATVSDVADFQLADTASVLSQVETQLRGIPIGDFFEQAYRLIALRDPETIVSDGLVDEFGLSEISLTDISDPYYFQTIEIQEQILKLLREYERESLTAADQLSHDIYGALLEMDIEAAQYRDYQYPATYDLWGWPGNTELFFLDLAPLQSNDDADNYLTLMTQLARRLRQISALLDARVLAGVREPAVTFDRARGEIEDIARRSAAESKYYTHFREQLADIDAISDEGKRELREQLLAILDQLVLPAYVNLESKMAGMLPQAPANIGFGQFSGGDEFYRFMLRENTSSDSTPDDIHQLGLQELERIHAEMRVIFDQLDYPKNESLASLLSRTDRDGGTIKGSEALAFFENIIDEAEANLADTFHALPMQKVQVIGGPIDGLYIGGSDDGTRVAAFYAQTDRNLAYATMPTLAYHEAIPGHHLQIALALERNFPRFRRYSNVTSYAEGWGQYAERLASDLGWYELDPYGDLGRLRFEALRAARLVLDTGIHAKGWSFQQAEQFNLENVGDTGSIARYSVSPGQASAYTTGMLKILELRHRAKTQLAERFDIRDFHEAVVGNGSMPLDLLEDVVDQYILEIRATP